MSCRCWGGGRRRFEGQVAPGHVCLFAVRLILDQNQHVLDVESQTQSN